MSISTRSTRHLSVGLVPLAWVAAAVASVGLLLASSASANPRALPFSYPYQTLPAEKFEVEQYVDMTPVRVSREAPDGTQEGVYGMRAVLQTELEFGLTDRLEFGWYFVFRQGASAATPFMRFQGVKQRLRLRLSEEGVWPVNVGLYLELAEFHNEFEVEEKLLLSRRFGPLNAIVNLWIEQEYYFQTRESKFIYNPTAGLTYELSPRVTVGAEYWVRGRFDGNDPTDQTGVNDVPTGARHYLGPTLLGQSGELWLSLGAYLRLDALGDSPVVADPFGRLWFRALIGYGF
ncbi:MAG: hypothetical protein RL685_3086 [Pseudomonadota bacterium]|jgi:hypothetical protein